MCLMLSIMKLPFVFLSISDAAAIADCCQRIFYGRHPVDLESRRRMDSISELYRLELPVFSRLTGNHRFAQNAMFYCTLPQLSSFLARVTV